MRTGWGELFGSQAAAGALLAVAILSPAWATAQTPLPSFQDSIVFSGLKNPTVLQFSPDGRVFVAEQSGLIKVFSSLTDTTPTIFADLRTKVHNYWDRGLLGMALPPNFPTNPYVYVLYAHDAAIGGVAPRWGTPGASTDGCPDPPGEIKDGCVVSGRLSRLQISGDVMVGSEQVLIEDWFQQYNHSIGTLAFGSDGALYAGGGEGASFNFTDYGQDGNPTNPGGDPPVPVGGTQTPPTAEGGSLRSQDLRTSGDPVTLDGAIIRVNPVTGAGLPDNPLASSSDPNARRIIAYGLRNPFRFALRPGTKEVWVGDVGWTTSGYEEINRIANASDSVVENFGWPCYEGASRQPSFDAVNLNICENLYLQPGAATPPFFEYRRNVSVVAGEACGNSNSAIAGLAFYNGGNYPSSYNGALFFADYVRSCLWVMFPGAGGVPDPATRQTFVAGAPSPVQLQIGPGGDLFYVDVKGGAIHRVRYFPANQPPTAVIQASPTNGPAPLTVSFNASSSTDPDPGDTLTYAWDLDGDGQYDDSTAVAPQRTYTTAGNYTVRLRVTDPAGASATASLVISAANTPPAATIAAPPAGTTVKAGDTVPFSGSALDTQDGSLPASALYWSLLLHHCTTPTDCHQHFVQDFPDVAGGSFPVPAHDAEFPTHFELKLTATDSGGLQDTKSVRIDYQTVLLTFNSNPTGLQIVVGGSGGTTPFTRTAVIGSDNSISAPTPQTLGGTTYEFLSWSDGGAQSHNFTAPASPTTYLAAYTVHSFFYTLPPCRLADTRGPAGSYGGPALAASDDRTFVVAGQCGIPATARAISANLTVTQGTAAGNLHVRAGGIPLPLASAINYRAGQTRANNAIVALGTAGDVAVWCGQASGTVHFILDVNGYFE